MDFRHPIPVTFLILIKYCPGGASLEYFEAKNQTAQCFFVGDLTCASSYFKFSSLSAKLFIQTQILLYRLVAPLRNLGTINRTRVRNNSGPAGEVSQWEREENPIKNCKKPLLQLK
jgi:hypothetical protein